MAFYFTLSGMTLWLETVLLIFLEAYAYHPIIITNPAHAYDDILAGNLFSQFSVSASMMLMIAVLRLKPKWYILLALAYGAIEELFIALGIYEHFWYRTWYTVALLPFAFLIARKMYDRLCEGLKPFFYIVYVGFSLFALTVVTLLWGLQLADIQSATTTLMKNPNMGKIGIIVAYDFVICIALLTAYFTGIRWRWKVLVLAALEGYYYAIYKAGLLIIRPDWFLPVSAVVLLWTYGCIVTVDRLYGLSGGMMRPLRKGLTSTRRMAV
jgi:hypothetical protein